MKTHNKIKTWVTLIITGPELKPEELTGLGINPDYFHLPYLKENGEMVQGYWQLNSNLEDVGEIEEHILSILKRIAPFRKDFKEKIQGTHSLFYCSVDFLGQESKGLSLSARILSLLSDLNISIQIYPN